MYVPRFGGGGGGGAKWQRRSELTAPSMMILPIVHYIPGINL